MIRDRFQYKSYLLCSLLLAALLLTGCQKSAEQAPPPQETVLQTEPNVPQGPTAQERDQAVSLYVDAMMLVELNEHAEAIRKLEQATELDPNFALAFSMKGDLYQQQKEYEKSAAAYKRATLLDPWSFKDFFNLGKVYQVMKQFADAVQAYVVAAKLDPDHFQSHLGAAQCYYELKEYKKAIEYAQKAQQLKPDNGTTDQLLGDVYEAMNDHTQAINSYRRAMEVEGNDPNIMVPLAKVYLRSGQYSAAKELLAAVIKIQPHNALAYQYMGFAHLRLKEIDEAIENYKQAVQEDKTDYMAHKSLGVAYIIQYLKTKDERLKALGLEQWNISLQLNPNQPKLKNLLDQYH